MGSKVVIPDLRGRKFTFAKTVSESDVYLFAGITGDFHPPHINEEYMKTTSMGTRIAHGTLTLSISITAATTFMNSVFDELDKAGLNALTKGYDRIRYIKPVFIGDTITGSYEIKEIREDRNETMGLLTVTNQKGETVLIAEHIVKYFPKVNS